MIQPADRALDDPPFGQHLEAFGAVGSLDDFQIDLAHCSTHGDAKRRSLIAGVGGRRLPSGQSRTTSPLRSSPMTGPSSLLRVAPPLCPASVLSPLGSTYLDFSLRIGATGSHVPHRSLAQSHAA